MSPTAPAANASRDVYVSSQDALYRVQQNLFGTTATSVPYPNGYETDDGQFLAISAIGFGQIYGYIYAPPALLSCNGNSEMIQVQLADVVYWVSGLEYLPLSPFFSAFLSIILEPLDPCPNSYNGVESFIVTLADYAVGGDLSCPHALTTTPPGVLPFAFYVIDEGSNPPRIVSFDSAGSPPPTSVVATLPGGAVYPDMAVYAPEPDAASIGAIALLGLSAFGARRRWRR